MLSAYSHYSLNLSKSRHSQPHVRTGPHTVSDLSSDPTADKGVKLERDPAQPVSTAQMPTHGLPKPVQGVCIRSKTFTLYFTLTKLCQTFLYQVVLLWCKYMGREQTSFHRKTMETD